ncbi:MAG: hypothetical protein HYX69_15030 [Planctomycetia bacterium]|nr:hypothetical protein [Planctomycetia bacterium]
MVTTSISRSRLRAISIAAVTLLVFAAGVAVAALTAGEVEVEVELASDGQHADLAADTVDWPGMFLAEFATGGAIVNPYALVPCAASCPDCPCDSSRRCCDHGTKADPVGADAWQVEEFLRPIEPPPFVVPAIAQGQVGNVVVEDGVVHLPPSFCQSCMRRYIAECSDRLRVPACTSGSLCDGDADRRPLKIPAAAATEIIGLRRSLGMDPVRGTIFDAPPPEVAAWAGDAFVSDGSDAETREMAFAAAIGRMETEQPPPVAAPPLAGIRRRVFVRAAGHAAAPPMDRKVESLRAAERKLQEAAEMLESQGLYERSDKARELAGDLRTEARQREEARGEAKGQAVSFTVPSER